MWMFLPKHTDMAAFRQYPSDLRSQLAEIVTFFTTVHYVILASLTDPLFRHRSFSPLSIAIQKKGMILLVPRNIAVGYHNRD